MIGWILALAVFVIVMNGPKRAPKLKPTLADQIASNGPRDTDYEMAKTWRENGHALSGKPIQDSWQYRMRTGIPDTAPHARMFDQICRDYGGLRTD